MMLFNDKAFTSTSTMTMIIILDIFNIRNRRYRCERLRIIPIQFNPSTIKRGIIFFLITILIVLHIDIVVGLIIIL